MKRKLFFAILFSMAALHQSVAQTMIGPSVSIFGQSLTDRTIVKDLNLKPKSPGLDFGVNTLSELSPFTSIRAGLNYSFQSFSYEFIEDSKSGELTTTDLNVQYINVSGGPHFTLFDEGTGKIRPYGEFLIGASFAVSKKSIDSPDFDSPIPPTNFNVMISPGVGAFVKVSEFTKFLFGFRYDRMLIEQFKDTDSRLNRYGLNTSIIFTL
ncbi:MAG: hypothetical protein ACK5C5_05740 [Bacteroidota bacterium]|jgi:hypothetical protein